MEYGMQKSPQNFPPCEPEICKMENFYFLWAFEAISWPFSWIRTPENELFSFEGRNETKCNSNLVENN